jgi:type I restriction enzyme R subunit
MSADAAFFGAVAGALRKVAPSNSDPSPETEQAVKQFFSEGLAAGEIVDVFALAGEDRPEISVLSDEFLNKLSATPNKNLGVAVLRKLLDDEIRVRRKKNAIQATLFSDRIDGVLARYHNRQITSADVIRELIEIAKEMRAARHRNEQLGLTEEEVAFYDALAGGTEETAQADPKIATIAHDLVQSIRGDLAVDWTSREDTKAKIRTKVKRLLKKHGYTPPAKSGGGGSLSLDDICLLLYAAWPEI